MHWPLMLQASVSSLPVAPKYVRHDHTYRNRVHAQLPIAYCVRLQHSLRLCCVLCAIRSARTEGLYRDLNQDEAEAVGECHTAKGL